MKTPGLQLRAWLGFEKTRLIDLLEVTKARLVSLVLWSVTVGFYLASRGPLSVGNLLKTLTGTFLVAAGAMTLNQWMERESDAKMLRTEKRPLPGGTIEPTAAFLLGTTLSLAGLVILTAGVNPLTGALTAFTLASYLLIYTPLKTRTPLCTLAGAVPGAMPPVLGWVAVRSSWNLEAWILFAILLVWQLPHVLAISWVYREDFGRAGFKMLAVQDPSGKRVGLRIVLYSALLIPLALIPSFVGMAGAYYGAGALALGIWFLMSGIRTARHLDSRAKAFFRDSIIYLSLLFLFLILDKRVF